MMTRAEVRGPWYQSLKKPYFTPPTFVSSFSCYPEIDAARFFPLRGFRCTLVSDDQARDDVIHQL